MPKHKSVEEIKRDMLNLEGQPPIVAKHVKLQKKVLQMFQEFCVSLVKEVVDGSKKRWSELSSSLLKREPYSYYTLKVVVDRGGFYA